MDVSNSNEFPIKLHSKKEMVSYNVTSLPIELIQDHI